MSRHNRATGKAEVIDAVEDEDSNAVLDHRSGKSAAFHERRPSPCGGFSGVRYRIFAAITRRFRAFVYGIERCAGSPATAVGIAQEVAISANGNEGMLIGGVGIAGQFHALGGQKLG